VGNISISGDANEIGETWSLDVSATLTTPPLSYEIPVTTNGKGGGGWSSLSSWSPNYLLAQVGDAGITVENSFIQGVEDPRQIPKITLDGSIKAVNSFNQGPSNWTNPLQISATASLSDFVPDGSDSVASASGTFTIQIPIVVVFDPIIEPGDSITVDQSDVDVHDLAINAGALLRTGDASDGDGLNVDGYVESNGVFDVRSSTAISVAGRFTNLSKASLSVEGSAQLSGPVTNAGTIVADGGTISTAGSITNTTTMEASSRGKLYLDASVSGGKLFAISSGVVQLGVTVVGGIDESGSLNGVTLGGDGSGGYIGGFTDYENETPDAASVGGDALQNVTVQSGVRFTALAGNNTALGGAIDNAGTLVTKPGIDDFYEDTPAGAFVVDGPVTLDGGGALEIDGELAPASSYVGDGFVLGLTPGADVLTNVDNTIDGSGSIEVAIVNQAKGVINGQGLSVNAALTNDGLVEATKDGSLNLNGAVTNAGTIVADGGIISVSDKLTDTGVFAAISGGQIDVTGRAAGGRLLTQGRENVFSGGVASEMIVSSGGTQYVLAAGSARGTLVNSGGYQIVSLGGVASGTTVVNGGRQYVYSGAIASATTISGGGKDAVGTAVHTGVEYVFDSGATTGTVVSSGGKELISSGGVANATKVYGGGSEYIFAGGLADGINIASGGVDRIESGGLANATMIAADGRETISSGGEVRGLTLSAGGVVTDDGEVRIAGAATLAGSLSGSGLLVQGAAGDLLLSGSDAAFSGLTVIEAGTVEAATAGALGTGNVQFVAPTTGSSVLQIDAANAPAAGGTFANTLIDFSSAGEDIDLRSIAYVSGASATVSGGVLVLTDGGKTYKFDLAGTTAGTCRVLADGHGGTLINPSASVTAKAIDPKVLAFAHKVAAFEPSDSGQATLAANTSSVGETRLLCVKVQASTGHP
jgi:autotransporter passenger strand-loop-strand repeat protein